MKKILGVSCILWCAFVGFAQVNMDSLGRIDYQSLHGVELNDVWGYTDELGNEYGLVGTTEGVSVVDVSTPSSPSEIYWHYSNESTWRDLKTYGDYAYVTTEASAGIAILDLSSLPDASGISTSYFFGESGSLETAHNLFIDENGFAYIFGSNIATGGVQIYDLNTDPLNPTKVGEFESWYVHDGYVQNDTLFAAHILDGFFTIVDVSDKANPTVLGSQNTPSDFGHNIWLSDDGNFVFTTDEVSDAYIGAYDISDVDNIVEVDRIQSSPGAGVIPHNAHVKGDFVITSYYSDGVVVHDATYPYNLIEVGNYDTYPLQTQSYDGCWGAYPFFDSDIILATDREYGLFVLGPTYQQGSYLEGTITNASTGDSLDNVNVTINGLNIEDFSNADGFYATGTIQEGVISVTYNKVGYHEETDNVAVSNGVVTINDVELFPISPYNLQVNVLEEGTNTPIENADIRIQGSLLTHEGTTNALGEETFTMYYEEEFEITAGKWEYKTKCAFEEIDATTGEITIHLESGYYDDFSFDYGWVATGDAATGLWERGIPFGTQENANPDRDAPLDCGDYAYVTGNASDYEITTDQVEDGEVILYSPIMNLTSYSDPHVNYARWFYLRYGPEPPDDSLKIYLSNGTETVQVDQKGFATFYDEWVYKSIRVQDFITPTATMQLIAHTADYNPEWNILEAGLDHFSVTEYNTIGVENVTQNELHVFPNPARTTLSVKNVQEAQEYYIVDAAGRTLKSGKLSVGENAINIEELESGTYILKVGIHSYNIMKL